MQSIFGLSARSFMPLDILGFEAVNDPWQPAEGDAAQQQNNENYQACHIQAEDDFFVFVAAA